MNIKIKKAFKEYNEKKVLEIDELDFEEGYVYALMGLNGSGKTTLLQCTSGLEVFTDGGVLYDGKAELNVVRHRMTAMMQKPYLFDSSALKNIELGLLFRKVAKEEISKRIKSYLSYFDVDDILHKSGKKLSGGEQAKIAMLRAAVLETEVTFLDEPTASMDIESTLRAERLIRSMAVGKRTVILVTHDLYQAERVADYIIFLDKGRIIEMGSKHKVFNAPSHSLVKQILSRGEGNDKNSNTNYQR